YSPTPAATFPARDHRRDRRFRTTRSRMRASWGQPPASLPLHCSGAPSPALAIRVVEPLKHLNEAVGHSLIDDLAIHHAQLHPDLRVDIGSELNYGIFFESLRVLGSYSWRWLVLVHLLFRARSEREKPGVLCLMVRGARETPSVRSEL